MPSIRTILAAVTAAFITSGVAMASSPAVNINPFIGAETPAVNQADGSTALTWCAVEDIPVSTNAPGVAIFETSAAEVLSFQPPMHDAGAVIEVGMDSTIGAGELYQLQIVGVELGAHVTHKVVASMIGVAIFETSAAEVLSFQPPMHDAGAVIEVGMDSTIGAGGLYQLQIVGVELGAHVTHKVVAFEESTGTSPPLTAGGAA